jgi:hypothetical protein
MSSEDSAVSWICKSCGKKGTFVPESSRKGAAIANHLSVETYHDRLEKAGYSLEWPQTPLIRGKETASKGFQKLLKRIGSWFRKN